MKVIQRPRAKLFNLQYLYLCKTAIEVDVNWKILPDKAPKVISVLQFVCVKIPLENKA